jgi:hypothetical protein
MYFLAYPFGRELFTHIWSSGNEVGIPASKREFSS